MASVSMAFGMLAVLVPLLALERGASAPLVGLIVASGHLVPALVAVRIGRFVDQVGTHRLLLIGAWGIVLVPFLVVASPTLGVLALAQVATGFFHVCLTVASQALVADIGTGGSHDRNFAWYSTGLSIGQLIGPLAAGVLGDAFGLRLGFGALAVPALVSLACVLRMLRAPSLGHDAADRARASTQHGVIAQTPLLAPTAMQLAVLSSCAILIAISTRQAFLPQYMVGLDFTATSVGLVLSLRAVSSVAVRPLMPQIVRRFRGRASALAAMVFLVALGVGLLGSGATLGALAALSLLSGIGTGVGLPLSIVTIASHVPAAERGTALAVRLTINRFAQLVAPVVIGVLVTLVGFGVAFGLAGIGMAAVALWIALLARSFDLAERTAEAHSP